MPLSDFPRHPLTFGPSPVHPLERLSRHLGGAAIWAKREDCNSGLAFGGNKTRKLEYLVPDALAQGATHLVSIGGVQSNHTRQVAAVAARIGLKALLVQESWVDWPDAVNDRVGNILLSRIMGADVRLVDAGFGIGFKSSWERALDEVGTLKGLTERRAILDKAIADHRGRIANTAGDSVLAEFGSAVATQIATHRRGGPLPERYKRRNGPRVGATGVTLRLDTLWGRSRPANRGRTYQAALTSIFFAGF